MPERIIFHHALDDEECERCHSLDLPRAKLIPLRPGTDIVLCVICLAEAIEHVTYWKMGNTITQYLAAAEVSRAIREERSKHGS